MFTNCLKRRLPFSMKILCLLLILTTFLFACRQNPPVESLPFEASGNKLAEEADTMTFPLVGETPESQSGREISFRLSDYLVRPVTHTDQTMIADHPMAIFVYPSEAEIRQLQLELGEDLAMVADDNAFYFSQASNWLDSLQMQRIVLDRRYIEFSQPDGKVLFLDTRSRKAPYWNLILFNPPKDPLIVSPVGLTPEDLHRYFDSKSLVN